MHVVFDLSGTVFGIVDMSLRPGIKETIGMLRASGVRVDFWTSGPLDYYSKMLEYAGISGNVFSKRDKLPFSPDVCVDDDPEGELPGKVYKVKPHLAEGFGSERILVAELLHSGENANFFWD